MALPMHMYARTVMAVGGAGLLGAVLPEYLVHESFRANPIKTTFWIFFGGGGFPVHPEFFPSTLPATVLKPQF